MSDWCYHQMINFQPYYGENKLHLDKIMIVPGLSGYIQRFKMLIINKDQQQYAIICCICFMCPYVISKTVIQSFGAPWSLSYDSLIYLYICNQCSFHH